MDKTNEKNEEHADDRASATGQRYRQTARWKNTSYKPSFQSHLGQ